MTPSRINLLKAWILVLTESLGDPFSMPSTLNPLCPEQTWESGFLGRACQTFQYLVQ